MQQIPQTIHSECPECGEETLHKTLKGRMKGMNKLEMVLKCSECGNVHKEILEAVAQISVRMIISRGETSERVPTQLPGDWTMKVGDEFMHDEERLQVTGIEKEGRRVDSCPVKDIQTLWTINFDTVSLKVSVNRDGRTKPLELEVDPEEEFEVGTEIEIDDLPLEIHSIKLKTHSIRRGSAEARDIVRIYCTDKRPVKKRRGRKPKHGSSW